MKGLKLIEQNYDWMENRDPWREDELGIFTANGTLTAFGKLAEFMNSLPPVDVYIGKSLNGEYESYPKFIVKEVEIN